MIFTELLMIGIQSHYRPSLKQWNSFQRSTSWLLVVSVFFATQVILWRMVIQHLCSLWVQSVIDLLKQFKVWYADRTFSTAPVPYAQVYILFGNKSECKILPCAFGVLPNKQMVTYISFWTQIKRMIDSKFFSRKCKNFLKTMSFIAAKINCSKELVEFSALIPLIAQYLKNS